MYGQLVGDPGEYTVQVRLVRVYRDDAGEETEHGVTAFEWRDIPVTGLDLAEPFAVAVMDVPFPEAGVYEFQLWADGSDEPLARERIEARE